MNKLAKTTIVVAALLAATLTSCKKDKPSGDPPAELNVSAATLTFTSSGGSKTFDVTSNLDWSVAGQPSWLTVSPASGKSGGTVAVTATAQPNPSTESRTADLSITVAGKSAKITATQDGAAAPTAPTPNPTLPEDFLIEN